MYAKAATNTPRSETVADNTRPRAALRIRVTGTVQGVGFRPFVKRLARELGIAGWVRNAGGLVEIHAEGAQASLQALREALHTQAPAGAAPQLPEYEPARTAHCRGFEVLPSVAAAPGPVHLPADRAVCDACLAELRDPGSRRHRHAFINCTACGPRYSIIHTLPFDRANTTMRAFTMCPACEHEYRTPADRRYHAQASCCPHCGPRLVLRGPTGIALRHERSALDEASRRLRAGEILALKGVGGFHLLCLARSHSAVARLRERKRRGGKPFAVMYPQCGTDGLELLRADVLVGSHGDALRSSARPIVLLPRAAHCTLADNIAPGLNEVGVLLPYSPLHHLLLDACGVPLVATSANRSAEPVLTSAAQVQALLGSVCDAVLDHDRDIIRPADDPVLRPIAGMLRPLRLGRGTAPLELPLSMRAGAPAVLALGAQQKLTLTLAAGGRAVVSPHLADMGSPAAMDALRRLTRELPALYGCRPDLVACDAHPDYDASREATRLGLPLSRVWHHHAHASALIGEYADAHRSGGDWIVFTWDGTGLGEDGDLWGGEALTGAPGRWQRAASLRRFRLPGGERAATQPWRSAAALCWEAGMDANALADDSGLLQQAWHKGVNAPASSAAGRVFDAASALLGLVRESGYEAEAPMRLETAAAGMGGTCVPMPLSTDEDGVLRSDWAPLIAHLRDARSSVAQRAADFHSSMAACVVNQALALRASTGISRVGLTGGVFQNRLLAARAMAGLREQGFTCFLPQRLPCNDAAISFGQAVETLAGSCTQASP